MGEINVGAQFDDKYITRDDKVALFYRFCYDISIDFCPETMYNHTQHQELSCINIQFFSRETAEPKNARQLKTVM